MKGVICLRKKLFSLFFAAVLLLSLLTPAAAASRTYKKNISRCSDLTGSLTSEELSLLDDRILQVLKRYRFDLPIFLTDDPGEDGLVVTARRWYETNEYGYGKDYDGLMLALDMSSGNFFLLRNGLGYTVFPDEDLDELENEVISLYDMTNSLYDFFCSCISAFTRRIARVIPPSSTDDEGQPLDTDPDGTVLADTGTDLPLAPDESSGHADQHVAGIRQETFSRITDLADLLSPSEEKNLLARIDALVDANRLDFVLLTDNAMPEGGSLENRAASFYADGSFGCGKSADGLILYFLDEPGSRDHVLLAFGHARSLLTAENRSSLEEQMRPFLNAGDYTGAAQAVLNGINALCAAGSSGPVSSVKLWAVFFAAAVAAAAAVFMVMIRRKQE